MYYAKEMIRKIVNVFLSKSTRDRLYLFNKFRNVNTVYITENNLRFGNAVIAIAQAIHLSKRYNFKLVFKEKYKLLKIKDSVMSDCVPVGKTLQVRLKYMYRINQSFFKTFFQSQIPLIVRNNIELDVPKEIQLRFDPVDTLVIHIRSGDIFDKNAHPLYRQPPFFYYKKIIDDYGFKKIHVVTEPDMKNPCIELIKQNYPHTIVQSGGLKNDIYAISHAQYLVMGIGTFVPAVLMFNSQIRVLFKPCDDALFLVVKTLLKEKIKDFFVADYALPEYFDNDWKVNDEEISKMKNFSNIQPLFDEEDILPFLPKDR